MDFIFLSIDANPKEYLIKKLVLQNEQETNRIIQNAIKQTDESIPKIASEDDFFEIDKKQKTLIEVSKRCAIQELVNKAPLIEGEVVEEDFFSFLTEEFLDFPVNTAVLKRKTNKSEMLYLFRLANVSGGNISHSNPEISEPSQFLAKGFSGTITKKLVSKMLSFAAKEGASAILSKLGTVVINMVLKELFGDDEQKMLDEIKKVIKQEIEGNEVSKIEGKIDGTIQFLTVEYKHMKEKADLNNIEKRKELLENLKQYSHAFYQDVIGVLKQPKYASRGIKTFAIGSAIHLLITQEMAMIDPDEMNPNNSGYLLTLRDNAEIYRSHMQTSFDKIIRDRNAKMKIYPHTFVDCLPSGSCVRKTTMRWSDDEAKELATGFTNTKNPKRSAYENAEISLNRYRTGVINKLIKDLDDPEKETIPALKKLTTFTFPTR